jgi:predicted RNA-binding Zn ribbon-like protein
MCLDLTHTGGAGEAARWEILHEPADVARFLGIIVGAEPPVVEAADMELVRAVRQAISDLARGRIAGVAEPRGAIDAINAAAAEPALVPRLEADGTCQWLPGNARQAISSIARDVINLYSSPLAERVRVCEAQDCGLLFVDASRPGTRRWCSMNWCGDRAKKRASGRPVRHGYGA